MNDTNRATHLVISGVLDCDESLSFICPSVSSLYARPAYEEGSMMPLPLGWTPGHWDVICERGER
jgi:hypothetical protein